MAIQQVVPAYISLVGDGSSTVFTFSITSLYQLGSNGTNGGFSVLASFMPISIEIDHPPVPLVSSTVDVNGNITISLVSALPNGVAQIFKVNMLYNSGQIVSASSIVPTAVAVVSGSINIAGGVSNLTADTQIKSVQGARAMVTQDFKDSGRIIKTYSAAFTSSTLEAMISLTPSADGTPGIAGATFTVTAGKRFRIQSLQLVCYNLNATLRSCQVNLRMSASGAVTTASQLIGTVGVTVPTAAVNTTDSRSIAFPDGIELSGTMQFGMSQQGLAIGGNTVVLAGFEY